MPLRQATRAAAVLCAALVAAAAAAERASAQAVRFIPASAANYSAARRPASAVRLVVIHVTEGSYGGTIQWFRSPRARASANYVVSREGALTQMVRDSNVAWHAGNAWVNLHSIGVEHEGYAAERAVFTDAQYRASARLVAGLLRRYVLPIDRRHVIGHNEVPDPLHPSLAGGFAHHTDPGRYWDWARYMSYVRSYARGVVPPPPAFDVAMPAFRLDQTLTGAVPWPVTLTGQPPARISFLVDGQIRANETRAPFVLHGAGGRWDTRVEANGEHTLMVRAVSAGGRTAEASVLITVKNPPVRPPQIASVGFVEGQLVTGAEPWKVVATGLIRRVDFLVDGRLRDTEAQAPYVYGGADGLWDTTAEALGRHTLTVRAVGPRATAIVNVSVLVVESAPR
jgi:N-acetyl-anhydromuramyl-L-alanine amidase AmpD